MTHTGSRMILSAVLLITIIAFVWGSSMATGTDSVSRSGRIVDWINQILHLNETDAETLHLVIRKMAHFTEFACLGLLLAWRFGMMGKKKGYLFGMPLLCGMAVACVDETIQVFVPDRNPSLVDVWIDTAGTAAGIAILLIGHNYIRKNHNTKNLEETT